MKLNFSLHLNSSEDKSVLTAFAVENSLLWDTSISFDQPSDEAFEVLLTDSAEEACCFLQNKRKLSEVIFFGDLSTVEAFFDGLLDVWPLHEKAELRRARFPFPVGIRRVALQESAHDHNRQRSGPYLVQG